MSNSQGRAFAGYDKQIFLPVKQKRQRKSARQLVQCLECGFHGRAATVDEVLREQGDGFSVRLGFKRDAVPSELLAQFAEILDNTVVDHGHWASFMRVRVRDRRRPVCGPAGVADSCLTRQRIVNKRVRQVHQFADRAAPVQNAVVHSRNPRAVIAAIL